MGDSIRKLSVSLWSYFLGKHRNTAWNTSCGRGLPHDCNSEARRTEDRSGTGQLAYDSWIITWVSWFYMYLKALSKVSVGSAFLARSYGGIASLLHPSTHPPASNHSPTNAMLYFVWTWDTCMAFLNRMGQMAPDLWLQDRSVAGRWSYGRLSWRCIKSVYKEAN